MEVELGATWATERGETFEVPWQRRQRRIAKVVPSEHHVVLDLELALVTIYLMGYAPRLTRASLPNKYRDLARKRVETRWTGYQQPEDFGYDFREWVSPYTKTACRIGGIALVLQDWASADGLRGKHDPDIQEYGRTPGLRTNKRLESLLDRVFGLALADVYATNAFPFIKPGGMSTAIPVGDVVRAVQLFVAAELAMVQPTMVLAVGALAHAALGRVGITSINVPHPAARIGNSEAYELAWRKALGQHCSVAAPLTRA